MFGTCSRAVPGDPGSELDLIGAETEAFSRYGRWELQREAISVFAGRQRWSPPVRGRGIRGVVVIVFGAHRRAWRLAAWMGPREGAPVRCVGLPKC